MLRILLAIFAVYSFSFADKLEWSHDYAAGLERVQKENKLMMLMFSQQGCAMCAYMHNTVFENQDVVDYVNAYYVPVELDIHKDSLPPRMKAYGTPTFYFVNAQGKKISKVIGGAKPPVFLQKLREIRQTAK